MAAVVSDDAGMLAPRQDVDFLLNDIEVFTCTKCITAAMARAPLHSVLHTHVQHHSNINTRRALSTKLSRDFGTIANSSVMLLTCLPRRKTPRYVQHTSCMLTNTAEARRVDDSAHANMFLCVQQFSLSCQFSLVPVEKDLLIETSHGH